MRSRTGRSARARALVGLLLAPGLAACFVDAGAATSCAADEPACATSDASASTPTTTTAASTSSVTTGGASTGGESTDASAGATTGDGATTTGDIEPTDASASTGVETGDGSTTGPVSVCGDGVVEGDEECDDGDDEPGDGCEPSCALTRIVKLACGAAHTCALSSGGAVRCWGLGQFAVLGYGSLETVGDDELPIDAGNVDVGTYDVVDIVAGGQHTCVRTSAGELRCWGAGAFGQLGLGSVEAIGDDEAPSTSGPTPLGGAVIQHAAMAQTGCVVLEGGALRCWGRNDGGQLGLGNTANVGDDELPTDVEPSLPWIEAARVSVGIRFACALEGGDVYCWGDAAYGQTGHGNLVTIGDNELPWPSTSAVAIGGSATQLVTGNAHACALLEGGALRCWGRNDYGQLGQAATLMIGDNEDPQDAPLSQVGGVITRIYANGGNTCALLEGGALRCWGINAESQLGVAGPPVGDNEHPGSVPPVEVGAEVVDACVGQTHVCALTAAGAARCWGDNKSGQLGYGHTQTIGDDETPAQAGDVSVF